MVCPLIVFVSCFHVLCSTQTSMSQDHWNRLRYFTSVNLMMRLTWETHTQTFVLSHLCPDVMEFNVFVGGYSFKFIFLWFCWDSGSNTLGVSHINPSLSALWWNHYQTSQVTLLILKIVYGIRCIGGWLTKLDLWITWKWVWTNSYQKVVLEVEWFLVVWVLCKSTPFLCNYM